MERVTTPEFMDDPGVDRAELRRALAYIRGVNRRLGGTGALLRCLRAWSAGWRRGEPVTLLDVGTGSGDIPLAARRWADCAGFDLRITGVDLHETTLDLAREFLGGAAGIELIRADAREIDRRFGAASFDYVHAGMFLHHLQDGDVLTVLGAMNRVARRGIVWNDLVRSGVSLAALGVLLIGQPAMVRHDARVSIRAGFTRAEAMDLTRRAGIRYARWRRVMWYRFVVAGEKAAGG